MFYLGSLFGLYFPYDFCLYPNATAVEVYAIKYIPFVVALTVCTAFGMLMRYTTDNAHIYTEHFNGVSINYVFSTYPAQVLY